MVERLVRIGVLTVSDRVSRGAMEDRGGTAVAEVLRSALSEVQIVHETVSDEPAAIGRMLKHWVDDEHLSAIFTTGGTGLGPRDVTPEATLEVITSRIPGIEEAIRARGRESVAAAMLSRGVAGVRDRTIIINLPGSPSGAREGAALVAPVLVHAIDLLEGRTAHVSQEAALPSASSDTDS